MKFTEYVAQQDRIYSEMARNKRKKRSQPVQMPKKDDGPMIIKADDLNVGWGHQPHASGTGVWAQGERRQRDRGAAKRAAIRDQE
jgi:hypothetical protein